MWCQTDNHVPVVAVTTECSAPEGMASGSRMNKHRDEKKLGAPVFFEPMIRVTSMTHSAQVQIDLAFLSNLGTQQHRVTSVIRPHVRLGDLTRQKAAAAAFHTKRESKNMCVLSVSRSGWLVPLHGQVVIPPIHLVIDRVYWFNARRSVSRRDGLLAQSPQPVAGRTIISRHSSS